MKKRIREIKTVESLFLTTGKIGDTLLTKATDANITSRAGYYKRKVRTERVLVLSKINDKNLVHERMTKITIVQ